MNSKERILAAINHKQPDRTPIDLGATPSSGISVVAYRNLINHLGLGHLANRVYDVIQEVTQPEMELLDHFGVDVLDIGREFNTAENYWQPLELISGTPALYPKWFNPVRQTDGSWLVPGKSGEFIGKMPMGATFFDQLIFPYRDGYPTDYADLGNQMSLAIWGGFGFTPYDWIDEPDFWQMLRDKTIDLRLNTDKALLLGVGCNLFEWGTFLRRIDNFLMDLYLEPENVHRLMDALMERHMEFLGKVCDAVGDIVDILKFGDDLGTNTGPFIPNEIYREFFLPRHQQMCNFVKANSSAHTMLHCCGGIYELIPDLIEAGFEILNPIQINAINMEPKKLKLEFGKELTFWGGGINTQSLLNRATPEEVKRHVTENLEAFTPGGGYVFNTVHNILSDVPPENIVAMFEAVKEFDN
ncbi:MAG: uroporphyrinogen decarboxylase family protein [Prolixibacteraceae bacterium]